jgi:protein tyrosine/serine phosphatase
LLNLEIDNVAEVDHGIWRGSQPDRHGFSQLAKHGVKTVIDLQADHDESADVSALGMTPRHIPMHASHSPSDEQIQEFLQILDDPDRRPVYFHCSCGCDRTGVMCAVFRMDRQGWTADDAVREMRLYSYHEWLFPGLASFVHERESQSMSHLLSSNFSLLACLSNAFFGNRMSHARPTVIETAADG